MTRMAVEERNVRKASHVPTERAARIAIPIPTTRKLVLAEERSVRKASRALMERATAIRMTKMKKVVAERKSADPNQASPAPPEMMTAILTKMKVVSGRKSANPNQASPVPTRTPTLTTRMVLDGERSPEQKVKKAM
jgi:hypothetical protein